MSRPQRYTYAESVTLLRDLAEQFPEVEWDREKGRIRSADWSESEGKGWEFRFPWPFPAPQPEDSLQDFAEELDEWPPAFYLILMQAGHAALGYFDGGELMFHKVIKKYMVRRKHGKAQIGHLSARGKSKAGSRIRLANTIQFFEDINGKLEEWAMEDEVERILVYCPVRMWSLWFGSRVAVPFERNDPRLMKVPLDIQRPGLEELERVASVGLCGYLNGQPNR